MGVGTLVAAFTSMIGVVVRQSDSICSDIDARLQDMRTEGLAQFEAFRSEIGTFRTD